MKQVSPWAWTAALLWCLALAGFGALLPGYSHALHPVAAPGALGMPRAAAFNLLAFVLPGALLAMVAWRLRARLGDGARVAARLGAMLVLFSALAFAAQGLSPLDPGDLDGGRSRLHALAWTLWWIAFASGAALFAAGSGRLRWTTAAACAVALPLAVLFPQWLGPGLSQRAAFAAWFGWMLAASARGAARPVDQGLR